jgi:tetratricopeptide (TPR) repeat protein
MPAFAVSSTTMAMEQIQAPWTLTASDGSGLMLTRVEAKAVFQGALAFTELHLYFHNPEARVREGTFAITLPPRAAVSRFAMENEGKWMEAEVVEKMIARRAYEDALHRKADPALLEKAEGNQFTARVFPIPAKGDKHLVVSFSQDLPGERYTLPLRGLPKTERVDVRLSLLGADGRKTEQTMSERNWQPDRDFVSTAPIAAEALSSGTMVAAQLAVLDASGAMPPKDAPVAMTILFDTSASRTLGFGANVGALDRLIAELRKRHGDELQLQVIAFDQETQVIFEGRAAGWSTTHKSALLERGAAGASDLGQAIAWVGSHSHNTRLVVIGDGVVTAGAKPEEITAAIKRLGATRVDVVLSGGIRDDQMASGLARAATRPGAVLDLDTGVEGVAAGLSETMLVDVAIDVRGASWVYPRKIASARPGTRVMVYARMPAPMQTLDVTINGHRHAVGLAGGTPALVARAVAAAELGELEGRLASSTGDRTALRGEIAKRSVAARVISSQTAMLVLETDTDYERFGIDRTALADILEVGPDGIVQRNRSSQIAATPKKKPPVKRLEKLQKKGTKNELSKELESADDSGADYDGAPDQTEEKQELEIRQPNTGAGSSSAPTTPQPVVTPRPPPPPPRPEPPRVVDPRPRLQRLERTAADAPAQRRPMVDGRRQGIRISRGNMDNPLAADDGDGREAWPPRNSPAALQGELAEISKAIAKRDTNAALARARAWHLKEPGNVLALIGLGETLEARREFGPAARAYGSIIDLFPGRADLRRFAGQRLERLATDKTAASRELAVDTYRRAVADRPDHMTGHRLLAYALLRAGKPAEAFAAILAGVDQKYPEGRFRGGDHVLADDAGLIGAAYAAAVPGKRADIAAALAKHKLTIANAASTRFILYWETDANDVDFHIQDAKGGHAFYSKPKLASGGELYGDVTTGYGPECFAIPGTPKAGPYRLSINYYSQGPMGYGMGLLEIVRHDGNGKLVFEDRPYVIMADHAYVDLGTYQ